MSEKTDWNVAVEYVDKLSKMYGWKASRAVKRSMAFELHCARCSAESINKLIESIESTR